MTRLTPFSKFLLVLAVVLGIFFLLKKFVPGFMGGSGAQTEQTTGQQDGSNANNSQEATTTADNSNNNTKGQSSNGGSNAGNSGSTSAFYYTPPAPVNPETMGVVEMGAEGFNYFIVNLDKDQNWDLKGAKWGTSFVKEGLATPQAIREKLSEGIRDMLNNYGVSGKNIHFVISSGAAKEAITQTIKNELSKLGYVINVVTPEKEGMYAYKAVVPKDFRDNSFMLDIGSGNTKISWLQDGKLQALETYGAKYFQDKITDDAAANDAKAKAFRIPANRRVNCFIVGGVPFSLAKKHRASETERYTVLKKPTDYQPDGAKEKAGLNIYKAMADGTKCDNFVFDWNGNFTIGFLLDLATSKAQRAAGK